MKTLAIMVGLPYSGKTTWILRHARTEFDELPPVVSPDEVRLALHGRRFAPEAERFVWATVHTMVRALFAFGHETVIVDATHTTRKRRAEWQDYPDLFDGLKIAYVILATPADVCRQRAELAGDSDILPVIDRMAEQFEHVAGDEGGYTLFVTSGP